MTSRWRSNEFIAEAARVAGWQLTTKHDRWLLDGVDRGVTWRCELTGKNMHTELSAQVNWICSALGVTDEQARRVLDTITVANIRAGNLPGADDLPATLTIGDAGPQTDLGQMWQLVKTRNLRGLFKADRSLTIDDSRGLIDAPLRARIERWPTAYVGTSDDRPAKIAWARVEPSGFRVVSSGWWDSAAALTHQIELGIDLAARLLAIRS